MPVAMVARCRGLKRNGRSNMDNYAGFNMPGLSFSDGSGDNYQKGVRKMSPGTAMESQGEGHAVEHARAAAHHAHTVAKHHAAPHEHKDASEYKAPQKKTGINIGIGPNPE